MWDTFRKKTIAAAPKHPKHEAGRSDDKDKDGENDLVHDKSHHAGGGRYVNPWPSATTSSWLPNSFGIPLTWAGKPHPELRSGSHTYMRTHLAWISDAERCIY